MVTEQTLGLAASIATIIAALAVVITAIIYYGQLRTMNKSRDLQSVLEIMQYANDPQGRKIGFLLYERKIEFTELFQLAPSWNSREQIDSKIRELSNGQLGIESLESALKRLNHICYLIRFGYAPTEVTEHLLKNSMLHSWDSFAPYIEYRRSRESTAVNGSSRYAEHFLWLISEFRRKDTLLSERTIKR